MIKSSTLKKVILSLREGVSVSFSSAEEQQLLEESELLLENGFQNLLVSVVLTHRERLLSLDQKSISIYQLALLAKDRELTKKTYLSLVTKVILLNILMAVVDMAMLKPFIR